MESNDGGPQYSDGLDVEITDIPEGGADMVAAPDAGAGGGGGVDAVAVTATNKPVIATQQKQQQAEEWLAVYESIDQERLVFIKLSQDQARKSARQLRNMLKYQIAFAVCVSLGLILLAIAFGLANLRKRADLLEFQECGSSWSEWKFYESWEKRYHARTRCQSTEYAPSVCPSHCTPTSEEKIGWEEPIQLICSRYSLDEIPHFANRNAYMIDNFTYLINASHVIVKSESSD